MHFWIQLLWTSYVISQQQVNVLLTRVDSLVPLYLPSVNIDICKEVELEKKFIAKLDKKHFKRQILCTHDRFKVYLR